MMDFNESGEEHLLLPLGTSHDGLIGGVAVDGSPFHQSMPPARRHRSTADKRTAKQQLNSQHVKQQLNSQHVKQQHNSPPVKQQHNSQHVKQQHNSQPVKQQHNSQHVKQQLNSQHVTNLSFMNHLPRPASPTSSGGHSAAPLDIEEVELHRHDNLHTTIMGVAPDTSRLLFEEAVHGAPSPRVSSGRSEVPATYVASALPATPQKHLNLKPSSPLDTPSLHRKHLQPQRLEPQPTTSSVTVLSADYHSLQPSTLPQHITAPLHGTPHDRQPQPTTRTHPTHQPPARTKISGMCFLIAVVHVIGFEYLSYVCFLLLPMVIAAPSSPWVLSFAVVNQVLFCLTIWSFVQCVITEPGTVPPNWGFYMGDKNKRRRYCQVCNIWKPDRTHHCSACGRCVLNMDHHCPWINNCVGFFNRKFFIQLLVYALLSCLLISIHGVIHLFRSTSFNWPYDKVSSVVNIQLAYALNIASHVSICIMLFIAIGLAFPLVPFLRFHLGLVLSNSTTIENMTTVRSKYDLGSTRNIQQVMSGCVLLWWLPLHTPSSRPAGDGVRWRQFYLSAIDDEA